MTRILTLVAAAGLAAPLSAQGLVERFLARDDQPLASYVAMRRLEASNARFNASGWMEACVELSIANGFTWRVTAEGGSGYIRKKVLRKALEGERDTIARGDPVRAALTADNYSIAERPSSQGDDPAGPARLDLTPKRQDRLLIHGGAFVSAPDADLVQVDGRLSKSPSFWTRQVELVRRYAR